MIFVIIYLAGKSIFRKIELYTHSNPFIRIISLSLERLDRVVESRGDVVETPKETLLVKRKSEEKLPTQKKQRRSSKGGVNTDGEIIIPPNHKVAALNQTDWILAIVLEYDPDTGLYTVKDADEETKSLPFTLQRDKIIPTTFTKRKSGPFEVQYDFPKGSQVMAVFPETTVFYKATVVSSSKRHKKINEYTLVFEDDEDEEGNIPKRKLNARLVVPTPEQAALL